MKLNQKWEKIFNEHNLIEQYSVRIYELDPFFYEHYEKKIQADKNGRQHILLRIDVYFNKFLLAVEIDEKGHTGRDSVFEGKRQKALEKNLVVNLLELIQVMQKMVMI